MEKLMYLGMPVIQDDLIAKEALRSVVPTFKTPEEVNKEIA